MENVYILGHENPDIDSIVSGILLEKIYTKLGYKVKFIIPDKKIDLESENICKKYGIDISNYQMKLDGNTNKFILVDHHERNIVGKIVHIIDHHPSDKNFDDIPYYLNENASSTTCILLEKYEKLLNRNDILLGCLAAFIDSASFHSTRTREKDLIMIKNLCKKYKINYDDLYKAGLSLTDISDIQKSCLNGLKTYILHGKKVESSYIQIEDMQSIQNEIDMMLNILSNKRKKENIDLFIFIVHDMAKFKTTVFYINENNIIKHKYNKYTSRGSSIIPEVNKKLKKEKQL